MQASLRSLAIRHDASPHGVITLSAGVASWGPPGSQTATSAQLIEMADTALYAAKALGRNAFTVHPNAETAAPAPSIAREAAE
jgi:PleD family two-component response regulator